MRQLFLTILFWGAVSSTAFSQIDYASLSQGVNWGNGPAGAAAKAIFNGGTYPGAQRWVLPGDYLVLFAEGIYTSNNEFVRLPAGTIMVKYGGELFSAKSGERIKQYYPFDPSALSGDTLKVTSYVCCGGTSSPATKKSVVMKSTPGYTPVSIGLTTTTTTTTKRRLKPGARKALIAVGSILVGGALITVVAVVASGRNDDASFSSSSGYSDPSTTSPGAAPTGHGGDPGGNGGHSPDGVGKRSNTPLPGNGSFRQAFLSLSF